MEIGPCELFDPVKQQVKRRGVIRGNTSSHGETQDQIYRKRKRSPRRCLTRSERAGQPRKRGPRTMMVVDMVVMITWRAGPAVSLHGSPTVSPVTAAL